jgi:hypothetical protein
MGPARARQHFPSVARARARAGDGPKSKAVAGGQGRALVDRSADPLREKCTDPHGCPGRGDRGATPALVGEDGGLIAGHARVLAARQLGIVEVPVMVAAGWSEAQKRAYVLADT